MLSKTTTVPLPIGCAIKRNKLSKPSKVREPTRKVARIRAIPPSKQTTISSQARRQAAVRVNLVAHHVANARSVAAADVVSCRDCGAVRAEIRTPELKAVATQIESLVKVDAVS